MKIFKSVYIVLLSILSLIITASFSTIDKDLHICKGESSKKYYYNKEYIDSSNCSAKACKVKLKEHYLSEKDTKINVTKDNYLKMLSYLIPFILGMFSSLIVSSISNRKSKKDNKKFIINYLSQFENLYPELINEYLFIKNNVLNNNLELIEIKLFEGFNTNILESLSFQDYFKIFKNKAANIYSIFNLVRSMEEYLPYKIYDEYMSTITLEIKDIEITDIDKYLSESNECALAKEKILKIITIKLSEIEELKNKINDVIS